MPVSLPPRLHSGQPRTQPAFLAVLALAILFTLALTATPALAIPEGRHYELVSPVFKGGYGAAGILAVAPDGERVSFASFGAFAGAPSNNPLEKAYIAHREAGAGWSTASLEIPQMIAGSSGVPNGYSPTLDSALYGEVRLGPNYGVAKEDATEAEFLLHPTGAPDTAPLAPEPGPNFELAGMVLKDLNETHLGFSFEGASEDFSHVIFEEPEGREHQLLPEAAKTESHLYDLATGVTGGERSLRLVALNNNGEGKALGPSCKPSLSGSGSNFHVVSADGSEVFFTQSPECHVDDNQVFVRLGGARTLEVSRPLDPSLAFGGCVGKGVPGEVPCQGAAERKESTLQGASRDGSIVFFTTAEALVAGSSDLSNNLYMARIGCPDGGTGCEAAERRVTQLVQVSRDPNPGEPAEVRRHVVTVASDGSRVYFAATGDLLTPAQNGVLVGEGRPVPHAGADNFYVYDTTTGAMSFIADLCSGPALSGAVEDGRCPPGLDSGESTSITTRNDTALGSEVIPRAHLNECARPAGECAGVLESGRFLVFSTFAQLTPDDTDASRDVYRYDAVTGALERVSVGEDGYSANGNGAIDAVLSLSTAAGSNSGYAWREMGVRALSEDGSRIVFVTAERLSPAAPSGPEGIYEWHEGRVALVASGATEQTGHGPVISSSGADIFFTTGQGLVPQDTDGQLDVYDARLGEGFSSLPVELQPCAGDACQGPLSNPAPLLVPGSVSQVAGGNLSQLAATVPPAARPKARACKKGYVKIMRKCVRKHRAKRASRRAHR
jgi:hypothetical protein